MSWGPSDELEAREAAEERRADLRAAREFWECGVVSTGSPQRCTCGPRPRGPPWDDGSEDGPCAYCEAVDEGRTNEDYEALEDGPAPNLDELEDGAWPPC
jgi:hypothetical protein